jgi:hypothetical protein
VGGRGYNLCPVRRVEIGMQSAEHHCHAGGFATIDVGPAWMVANQNPIVVPRNRTNAVATLSWNAPGASVVEIHVGSATGPLFMVSGPTGSAQTGAWVTDGLEFFLVDVSNGRPGTTVGTATVFLVNQS